jgi:hypothetical protein
MYDSENIVTTLLFHIPSHPLVLDLSLEYGLHIDEFVISCAGQELPTVKEGLPSGS